MTGHRILVVDDEPQIPRFLEPSLTAAGFEAQGRLVEFTFKKSGVLRKTGITLHPRLV